MKLQLHTQIFLALLAAAVAGSTLGHLDGFIEACRFVGTMFLNALKLLIVPLVWSAMITGLSAAGSGKSVGRMGVVTLAFYIGSGLLAILTGLVFTNLLAPGLIDGKPAGELLGLSADTAQVIAGVEGKGAADMLAVLQRLVPSNIFAAAAQGDMLGLLLFGFGFGYLVSQLPAELAQTQRQFWQGVYEIMTRIAQFIMKLAPAGVFALVAPIIAKTGWDAVKPLSLFFITVVLGLLFHAVVTLPILLRVIARVSPLRHFRAMQPALITAFSTSSSAASLPVTLDCIENRAGVSRRVTGFVLPVGANVNTDGTALYECAAALFIAQAYGLQLDFTVQFIIVLTALLTSVGVAGIPSASLVAIAIILGAIGLPLEGVGLILAVDRVLDMCRTSVNVLGDSVATVIVARMEGETEVLKG